MDPSGGGYCRRRGGLLQLGRRKDGIDLARRRARRSPTKILARQKHYSLSLHLRLHPSSENRNEACAVCPIRVYQYISEHSPIKHAISPEKDIQEQHVSSHPYPEPASSFQTCGRSEIRDVFKRNTCDSASGDVSNASEDVSNDDSDEKKRTKPSDGSRKK